MIKGAILSAVIFEELRRCIRYSMLRDVLYLYIQPYPKYFICKKVMLESSSSGQQLIIGMIHKRPQGLEESEILVF